MSFVNNVRTTLSTVLSSIATEVNVAKSVVPFNDPPVSGKLTLMNNIFDPEKIEIISYTGRVDNTTFWTLTGVTRGIEGTAGTSFLSGAVVFQAFTAQDAQDALATEGGPTTPSLREPVITYVDSKIARIDYAGGEFKVFDYNVDGTLNTISLTIGSDTTTKTLNYTAGVLTSVTEA